MKKFLALLLALVMLFSLAACGGGDEDNTPSGSSNTPPSSSQQQEQQPSNAPAPGNDDNQPSGGETFAWPSEVEEIAWTGAGKIVGIDELAGSDKGEVWIYIDTATLDEVGAYIEMLKGRGISYHGMDEEPALAFEYGEYAWAGKSNALRITLLEEPDTTAAVDGTYQLKIAVYKEVDY